IPFGNVLLVAFFFLTAIAATTAMISMMEVPVAYLNESKKIPRKKAVLSVAVIIMLIGILASLSADGASLLGGAKVFGLTFFNLFDFVSSNILMPLGGFLILIVVGWFLSKKDFEYELSNKGSINTKTAADMLYLVIKYVTPVLLIIVFLNTLGIIRLS
ncbi:MAG TPA: transporter, partial [Clostridiaceae bacterium]|nr:transporter [Clostridiaceae bacterium]